MRLPDFLIIGAARSGTTTLYRDLQTHPSIFFPGVKEPGHLLDDRVLTEAGRAEYARLFDAARPDQLCAEATTLYTHRPDHEGVAGRARRVCGEELRSIYIVRNPVHKIVSTHHLYVSRGWCSPDIDVAVREQPRLLNHARYAMQLEPWLEAFGSRRVRVVRFESYVRARRAACAELQAFLGLDPRPDRLAPDRVFNQARSETRPAGPFRALSRNRAYRRWLRPLLSEDARAWIRRRLLPRMPDRPAPPTPETLEFILEALADDLERQPALFGTGKPLWDLSQLRAVR